MSVMRILLVEDEDALRQLLAKYLVRLGYEVDAAPSAEAAWTLFEQNGDVFSLLLVDLTLPGMSGDELMRRILNASANVRVLLSSGYPYDLSKMPAAVSDRAAFLQKPYLPRQLADQIKAMVGGHEKSV